MAALQMARLGKGWSMPFYATLPTWGRPGTDGGLLSGFCQGLIEDEEISGGLLPGEGSSRNAKREAKVLDVYKGVLPCRLDPEWRGDDGGVYVGRGNAHTTCSVFCEACRDTLDRFAACSALSGRPLYVLASELDVGREVIDRFEVQPRNCWNQTVWKRWFGFWLAGRRSAFVGLVLKIGVRAKPGQWGNFLRILPSLARKHFKPSPVELLLLALPADSQDEVRLQSDGCVGVERDG